MINSQNGNYLFELFLEILKSTLWLGQCPDEFVMLAGARWLKHNGPAIWGGCVTRHKHRAESWFFSQKAITVQGGYGAFFAIQVPNFLAFTSVAVQSCQGVSQLSRCS